MLSAFRHEWSTIIEILQDHFSPEIKTDRKVSAFRLRFLVYLDHNQYQGQITGGDFRPNHRKSPQWFTSASSRLRNQLPNAGKTQSCLFCLANHCELCRSTPLSQDLFAVFLQKRCINLLKLTSFLNNINTFGLLWDSSINQFPMYSRTW